MLTSSREVSYREMSPRGLIPLASPEAKLGRQLASPEGEVVLASPEASTEMPFRAEVILGEISPRRNADGFSKSMRLIHAK